MTVDLAGRLLAEVRCDVALVMVTADGWHLTVENDYTWTMSDGPVLRTADVDEARIVGDLERSVGTAVVAFSCDESGGMTLELVSGRLDVVASAAFESWNLVGPEGQRVVSMPGGALAVWS